MAAQSHCDGPPASVSPSGESDGKSRHFECRSPRLSAGRRSPRMASRRTPYPVRRRPHIMDSQIRLVIDRRAPFADGQTFGDAGGYELLSGRVDFAVDPAAAEFSAVVDLEHAPRNADGLVEYSADVYMLKPLDLERGNGRIFYDVNNRGNLRCLQFFNDAVHDNAPSALEHAGNGFLMRRGYTVVWSGWQGDISPGAGRLTMRLPVASLDGEPITGAVRTEFMVEESGVTAIPLSGNHYTDSYEAASTDTSACTFTVREYEGDPRVSIPADRWSFAALNDDGEATPSPFWCHLPEGFRPGWLYELIYEAKDPRVLGLGFTGVRDLLAFLRRDAVDSNDTPNPLRENGAGIERVYGWGRSQSGRFLREFVYRGFNADASGRRVFDAVSPHVSGGGRVTLKLPFRPAGPLPARAQRPPLSLRPVPVCLPHHDRRSDRQDRRHPEAARHRPPGDPYPDRVGVLGPPRFAGAHRLPRRRSAGPRARPSVPIHRLPTQRRPARRAERGQPPPPVQSAQHHAAAARAARPPGRLVHLRRCAARKPRAHPTRRDRRSRRRR